MKSWFQNKKSGNKAVSKLLIDPPRSWRWICLFFVLGLLVASAMIFLLKINITSERKAAADQAQEKTEILDEAKLNLILADQIKRDLEYERWNREKPVIVDPGL